mmetsp:Transcript_10711/g.16231  ORF Transcript_10711/g.16231 Transcript_10711/m.16231 type:complete len:338 (-) Transcript_10711:325-1338(-)|eukprot:CAMPEP_0185025110 /NCGR_PEP_ID=MMETSP1103-20130426/8193_1 /TAXON_ID=36769 /ORGANISM="Paraphysomonas bandaiensis, Strain Caron Lab Isolate" /LENGTH=337 /DNA_ID=CAMNT_0027558233 /DNA_START=101 /DNA_END=1114 /DNA_ORIENTATION=+
MVTDWYVVKTILGRLDYTLLMITLRKLSPDLEDSSLSDEFIKTLSRPHSQIEDIRVRTDRMFPGRLSVAEISNLQLYVSIFNLARAANISFEKYCVSVDQYLLPPTLLSYGRFEKNHSRLFRDLMLSQSLKKLSPNKVASISGISINRILKEAPAQSHSVNKASDESTTSPMDSRNKPNADTKSSKTTSVSLKRSKSKRKGKKSAVLLRSHSDPHEPTLPQVVPPLQRMQSMGTFGNHKQYPINTGRTSGRTTGRSGNGKTTLPQIESPLIQHSRSEDIIPMRRAKSLDRMPIFQSFSEDRALNVIPSIKLVNGDVYVHDFVATPMGLMRSDSRVFN